MAKTREVLLTVQNSLGAASTANGRVLNSWKEIASYMGRGMRTVQRYETQLGLPVRRPAGKDRSAVVAFSIELDTWLSVAPRRDALSLRNTECETVSKTLERILRHAAECADCRSRLQTVLGRYGKPAGRFAKSA